MIKKVLFGVAALLICGAGLMAMNMDGYVKVYWDRLVHKLKRVPSLEDRVAKLKLDINRMDDELKNGIGEEIRLEREGTRIKKEMDSEKEKLTAFETEHQKLYTALSASVEAKKTQVSYDNEEMSRDIATRRLASLNTLVEAQRKTVDKLKEDEQTQATALATVRKDLQQLRDDKAKFETLAKTMELRVKQIRQTERENKVGLDRGRVGQIETEISEIEDDLGVRERFVEKEKEYGVIKAKQAREETKTQSAEDVLKAAQKINGK